MLTIPEPNSGSFQVICCDHVLTIYSHTLDWDTGGLMKTFHVKLVLIHGDTREIKALDSEECVQHSQTSSDYSLAWSTELLWYGFIDNSIKGIKRMWYCTSQGLVIWLEQNSSHLLMWMEWCTCRSYRSKIVLTHSYKDRTLTTVEVWESGLNGGLPWVCVCKTTE